MSLDKIYELDEKAEKRKEEFETAKREYNYVLIDLEKERQKFKKIIGIVDPVEKEPFSLWNLIKEMFDMSELQGFYLSMGIGIIGLGFLFLMVNIIPFLFLGGMGMILCLVGCIHYWVWKRRMK